MRAARAARLFLHIQPIRSMICGAAVHRGRCLNSLINGNASELQIPSFAILLLDANTKDMPSAPFKAIPMETVTMV